MDENKSDFEKHAQKVGEQIQDVAEKAGKKTAETFEEAKKAFGPGLKSFADKLRAGLKGDPPKKDDGANG